MVTAASLNEVESHFRQMLALPNAVYELLALVKPEELFKTVLKVERPRPLMQMWLPALRLELPRSLFIPLPREVSFAGGSNAVDSF